MGLLDGGWLGGLSGNLDHLNPFEVEVELGKHNPPIWNIKETQPLQKILIKNDCMYVTRYQYEKIPQS